MEGRGQKLLPLTLRARQLKGGGPWSDPDPVGGHQWRPYHIEDMSKTIQQLYWHNGSSVKQPNCTAKHPGT